MFISYKELSASSRVKRRRRNAPIGANALFRWNRRLLSTSSKGDAPDIAVTVKNQAGRIRRIGIGSPIVIHHPSYLYYVYIPQREDFIHVLRWLHKIGRAAEVSALSRPRLFRVAHRYTHIIIGNFIIWRTRVVSNRKEIIIRTSGKQQQQASTTGNTGRRRRRKLYLFIWDYTGNSP